jgi:predicted transcriptional regulator
MEKHLLSQMVEEGLSGYAIARRMGKATNTIQYWLKKHGLKTKYQKKQRSPIRDIGVNELKKLMESSMYVAEVLRHFGLENKGNNYLTLKSHLKEEGLLHLYDELVQRGLKKRREGCEWKLAPLDKIFIKNSSSTNATVKRRAVSAGLLKEECAICELGTKWKGKSLVLTLDHINGDNRDNRLSNIRLLCPNCHSQTPTFAGRSAKTYPKVRPMCVACEADIKNGAKYFCSNKCRADQDQRTVWPEPKELKKLVWELPTSHIARKLGVSDVAVSKRCKKYGIEKPPRGYWAKKRAGKI